MILLSEKSDQVVIFLLILYDHVVALSNKLSRCIIMVTKQNIALQIESLII